MRSQSGQIVVEYVLLLAISVSIAIVVISQLINRDSNDPGNSGAVIQKWTEIQKTIGEDVQNK